FHRIRYADGAPMALEYSTVPASCLSGVEAVSTSLYQALSVSGHRPNRALQRLRAVLFNAEQCELLGIAPGAPGLLIERRAFHNGEPVEVTQSYYRGDAYDFVAELNDGPA
ncbi:MAG: GntR family transcriptional regulator, partial [Brevundimonas sp.]